MGKRAKPKCPPLQKKKAPSRRVKISPPNRPSPSRGLQVPAENDTSLTDIGLIEMLLGLNVAKANLIPVASRIKPRKDTNIERKKRRIGGRGGEESQFSILEDTE